jgi:hypothetical protein
VIEPPVLKIGPETVVEMLVFAPVQAALAAPGRPSAASAMSDAEASSAGRERPTLGGAKWLRERGPFCPPSRLQRCFALMTSAPMTNSMFYFFTGSSSNNKTAALA